MYKSSVSKVFLSLLLLTVFVTGCEKKQQAERTMPPQKVEVTVVEKKDEPFDALFVGITEGSRAVEVKAQVGGILKERVYNEGQYVNAGDVLFIIESDTYEAALKSAKGNLDMAKAQLVEAKLNYERLSNLYKTKSISKKDYDAAVASYNSAKAQVETAMGNLNDSQIRLGYTKVIAPVSGYTSKANYTVGNLITTGATTPLTVINKVDPLYVNFSIPATTMTTLRLLQKDKVVFMNKQLMSTVYTENNMKYPETGKVIFLDTMITPSTGDIKIRAEFKNPYMALLPGQYVRASLDGITFKDSIVIPQKAILQREGKQQVIRIDRVKVQDDGKEVEKDIATFVPVKLGLNMGDKFLVLDGLKAGDRIVVEGTNKVSRNGSPVTIVESEKGQQAQAK